MVRRGFGRLAAAAGILLPALVMITRIAALKDLAAQAEMAVTAGAVLLYLLKDLLWILLPFAQKKAKDPS